MQEREIPHPITHCPVYRTVRYVYLSHLNKQEVVPMNENVQPTTSTAAQQIVGALYLLALLAAVVLILL